MISARAAAHLVSAVRGDGWCNWLNNEHSDQCDRLAMAIAARDLEWFRSSADVIDATKAKFGEVRAAALKEAAAWFRDCASDDGGGVTLGFVAGAIELLAISVARKSGT